MQSALLTTKLRIPPLPRQTVHRARLVDALERGVPDHKLILLSAPAGYGKTTLLAQWAHASRLPIAWLSLGEEDNDPDRFFRYLLTAWEAVQPGVRDSPLGLLLGAMEPDREAVLTALINVANTVSDELVFVLDDYHLIHDPSVHSALAFLLDHLPPTLHFVLAGRGDPPLPLARYRARRELLELRTEDLQFRQPETADLLNRLLGLNVGDDELVALHSQLEGWAAGLQLVSLTLRRHREAAEPAVVSGRHRFIADYLREDVLAHLPAGVRRFLLQTSILDRLCGPLCAAVTGTENSQAMLELLERENLFFVPLDDRREWFRFHPLFAGVLREELHRQHGPEVVQLHGRAASWYLHHAMPEQAFAHAVAGNDVDLVTRIGEDYCVIKMESGELNVVARWLQLIPEAWFATYPLVSLLRVAFLIYTGAFEESVRLLEEIEERMRRSDRRDKREQLAKAATVRCAIACFQNDLPLAEAYASEALAQLPTEDRFYRVSIYHALGETYGRNACWDQAKDAFLQALDVVHEPSFRIRSVHIYGALADLELRQGHLETASAYWSRALEAIQERELWGRLPIPVTGWVSIRMGEILYERNCLDDARNHLVRGLELAQLGGDVRSSIAGHLLSARLTLTEGDIDLATDYLDRARPLLERAPLPEWTSRYERCQLELWLVQDRLRAVIHWVDSMGTDDLGDSRDEPAIDRLTLARALLVKGHRPDRERALNILRHLIEAAEAHGRQGILIEALALQALALWAEGDRAGALLSLERALRLAEPEGYVRLFADLGLPMVRLLQEARSRKVLPDYVARLLAACGADFTSAPVKDALPPEPLSEREGEVLRLIAAGLTNREIAAALFISPETVKKHTGSIYGKLGVGHRTEAVARARGLAVLD
ncbi:MAG: LuxR C-terminal-related transcriptional regulator [Thermomicrobiales bacterium]